MTVYCYLFHVTVGIILYVTTTAVGLLIHLSNTYLLTYLLLASVVLSRLNIALGSYLNGHT